MGEVEFRKQVLNLTERLYLTAFRFLKNVEEAEDAVQDIFLNLWNKRDIIDKYDNFEALAIASLKNRCIDILRKRKQIVFENEINLERYSELSFTPPSTIESDETEKLWNHIVSKLPEQVQKVYTMHEMDELSYDEISAITSLPVSTLRVIISRARKHIRNEFGRIRDGYK